MKKIVIAIPFIALTLASAAQNKPERDPFVNLGQKTPVAVEHSLKTTNQPARIAARPHREHSVDVARPDVSVLGLVTSSRQPKAILAGPTRTFIVAQGDKLGDYRVTRIDRSGITLAYKQTRYHCPIGQ